jgi:hypothetical protein
VELKVTETLKTFLSVGCAKISTAMKRDGVTREWRKLHNEELNALYSSPNIVWEIKPRRMR